MSEEQDPTTIDPNPSPPEPTASGGDRPGPMKRWAWPLVIGALAAIGVLLAIADISLHSPGMGPLSNVAIGPAVMASPLSTHFPGVDRFERGRTIQAFTFRSPFSPLGPVSPFQGLRALLSNGAGLIFIALAVLVVFPNRARTAVQRLEDRHGPEIALAAGVATVLLILAALLVLRFTLIFLVLVPVLIAVTVAIALFGIACIALALGRFLERRIGLGTTHPLIAALAGTLIVFDLAVLPYAGLIALAAVAIGGLGIAVVTRFGSDTGWSFADLKW